MNERIDYLPYLRKMIGHQECLSVGVSCLILDENGRILLEKRSDSGLYCRPGGSLDLHESVTDGVKREVYEETGLVLKNISLFMILSGDKCRITYPNGDITEYVDLVFISQVNSKSLDQMKLDCESTSVGFFDISSLPPKSQLLQGTLDPILKYLAQDFEVRVD